MQGPAHNPANAANASTDRLPFVSIVTVNWNGLEDTTECLESVAAQSYPSYAITVVDNASDGDDAARLKRRFGSLIQLVQNDRNYGCGEGYNRGILAAVERDDPEYVLVLNNDVVLDPGLLGELVAVAESDERIGVVGPKIYYYDYRGRKDIIWSAGGTLHYWSPRIPYQRGVGREDGPEFSSRRDVDWLSGAVLLVRPSILRKVGFFNPWYFYGAEDIELCLKARRHGARLLYVPTAMAWHKEGVAARKLGLLHVDPAAYYYFVRQCFPWYVCVYQRVLFPALLARWAVRYITRRRHEPLRPFISQLMKSLTGHALRNRAEQ
ncbi:MAG: glycosyltransferase family 2 protein [Chloroflexota bacterium]